MKISIGDYAEFSKTISETDVYGFAGITGDLNSVHINEVAAKNSVFGQRIAHGMLVAGLISTVLGMYLPGPGTIYLSQNISFVTFVLIGDTITASAKVVEVLNKEKGIYRIQTLCKNQRGELVIEGEAVVKYKV